ncbi:MAG: electron transfer flavoprotein subunit alpha/FixB family protein, partial [Gammaproteobacteria bacterium]|nr:electron transfer flavoprotein subunit alpha/FixB family protein [Gammaproteobacteria bacterium]
MSVLVLAEHDNKSVSEATLTTITAAQAFGGELALLVVGHQCQDIAAAAAKIPNCARVLVADDAHFADGLAENVADVVVSVADGYTHILAASTTYGRNILPRVA